jgi:hypothetical protein
MFKIVFGTMIVNLPLAIVLSDFNDFRYVTEAKEGGRNVGNYIPTIPHHLEIIKSSLNRPRHNAPKYTRTAEANTLDLAIRTIEDTIFIAEQRNSSSV